MCQSIDSKGNPSDIYLAAVEFFLADDAPAPTTADAGISAAPILAVVAVAASSVFTIAAIAHKEEEDKQFRRRRRRRRRR